MGGAGYRRVAFSDPWGLYPWDNWATRWFNRSWAASRAEADRLAANRANPNYRASGEVISTGHEAFVAGGLQGAFGLGRGLLASSLAGAAESGGEAALFNGSRAALRTALSDGVEGLSEGQASNISRQLGKGAVDNITVTAGEDGAVTAQFTRAGRNGYQTLTKTIDAEGRTTNMVQTAYDASGKLVEGEVWK